MDSAEAGTLSAVYSEYIVTSENAPRAHYTRASIVQQVRAGRYTLSWWSCICSSCIRRLEHVQQAVAGEVESLCSLMSSKSLLLSPVCPGVI